MKFIPINFILIPANIKIFWTRGLLVFFSSLAFISSLFICGCSGKISPSPAGLNKVWIKAEPVWVSPLENQTVIFRIGFPKDIKMPREAVLDLGPINQEKADLLKNGERESSPTEKIYRFQVEIDGRRFSLNHLDLTLKWPEGTQVSILLPILVGFQWGVVFNPGQRNLPEQVGNLGDLGADFGRFWLDWSKIQATAFRFDPATQELVWENNSAYSYPSLESIAGSSGLIDEYAGHLTWTEFDTFVQSLIQARIAPLPLIADATTAPLAPGTQARIAPEDEGWTDSACILGTCVDYVGIGREAYLAQAYLHAAALARRYRDRIGVWNLENELNWAYVHTGVAGWRVGSAWSDPEFCRRLLKTLADGIKAGNPSALATMNFNIHDPAYLQKIGDWADPLDLIGLGAYPNYLFATPIMSSLLSDAIQNVKALATKPVLVLETGYPSGPAAKGYSENLQVQYLNESIRFTEENGGAGYFYFHLEDPPGAPDPSNLQAVEYYWGLTYPDGTTKPAYGEFKSLIADSR